MFPNEPSPELPDDRPSAARIYDYLLGGHHNFAVDRQAGDYLSEINPDAPLVMWANRAFLRRAVNFLLAQGIDQFLDIGSGIPTVGNVHEIAQRTAPAARIVYVDNDPIAVRQSLAILGDQATVTALRADARQPEAILAHPTVQGLLDFRRPVALLLVALLHFVPDDDAANRIVRILCAALAPGSFLVLSHGTYEGVPDEIVERGERLYAGTANPFKVRTRAHISAFFEGLDLVPPGLVYTPLWRPEGPHDPFLDQPARSGVFAAVGRKA